MDDTWLFVDLALEVSSVETVPVVVVAGGIATLS